MAAGLEISMEEGVARVDGNDNSSSNPSDTSNVRKKFELLPAFKKALDKWWLLWVNCALMAIGTIGGPLLLRFYYLHGGKRKWLPGWMQTAGFPLLLVPLTILYRKGDAKGLKFLAEPRILISSAMIGILLGIDNFMYSQGLSYVPVSTSSLLSAMQLAFTAIFALIIVKQKFTPYSINAVVLMTLGSILLGVGKSGDRASHVSSAQYMVGFILTLGAAALLGFISPCAELTYAKARKAINYTTVMQFQFGVTMFATIFSTIGVLSNKDFAAMPREAKAFDVGPTKYYVTIAMNAVVWQCTFIGSLGVIFCSSSLFSGIMNATMLPLTEVAAVIVFKEKFNGIKGMSLAMCLWGFTSYFYGSYREDKKKGGCS